MKRRSGKWNKLVIRLHYIGTPAINNGMSVHEIKCRSKDRDEHGKHSDGTLLLEYQSLQLTGRSLTTDDVGHFFTGERDGLEKTRRHVPQRVDKTKDYISHALNRLT